MVVDGYHLLIGIRVVSSDEVLFDDEDGIRWIVGIHLA